MKIFKDLSKFKHSKTGLYISLVQEKTKESYSVGIFDILIDEVKEGYIEAHFYKKENTLYVANIFLASKFSNNNFTKDLFDWSSDVIKNNKCKYITANPFYAAEKIVKDKNWKENNINLIGNYIYEVGR